MTQSEQLFAKLDLIVRDNRSDPPTPVAGLEVEILARWFTELWYVIRTSVPLLQTAMNVLREDHRGDEFSAALISYYEKHAREESRHDEWLLEDLSCLDIDTRALNVQLPAEGAVSMAGSQYYLIYHHHPACLLGYMAFCEGYAPRRDLVLDLQRDSSVPPEAWRTYLLHADEDVEHRRELCRMIDSVPSEAPGLMNAITLNALRTAAQWRGVMNDLAPA